MKRYVCKNYKDIVEELNRISLGEKECVAGFNTNGWVKCEMNQLIDEPQFANGKGGIFVKTNQK